jgi:sulfate adenylyltransferase subunit 1
MAISSVLQDSTFSLEDFLANESQKDLLRFSTAGSVDDGKSTLIGRLLYDTQSVYEDQVRSIEGKGTTGPGQLDFALLTDGLRAEREQGITIDVAYRYFSTARRKFIIADTPGHEQYTRNMATGASTADAAIVLIDARKGVLVQSRRHAYINSLFGVRHVIVAVNKMDLVDYDEAKFLDIQEEFRDVLAQIHADTGSDAQAYFVPVSALVGDNIVHRSGAMPWYPGPALLQLLEEVPAAVHRLSAPLRFPVQRVLRPDLDFRGFAGQIASGSIRAGDKITVLPSRQSALVKRIVTFDGDLAEAHAPLSVTLVLGEELDVSRGDLLVAGDAPATLTKEFKASLVWMDPKPLDCDRRYLLKHTSQTVPVNVSALDHGVDIRTLEHTLSSTLEMNAIGVATLSLLRPIPLDRYAENRSTGSFILIDPETNRTVAAGMVASVAPLEEQKHASVASAVRIEERVARWGHRGGVLSLTGSAAIIDQVERALFADGAVTLRTTCADDAEWIVEAGILLLVATPQQGTTFSASVDGQEIVIDSVDPEEAIATVRGLIRRSGMSKERLQ